MLRQRPNAKRPPNAPAWLLETHTLGSQRHRHRRNGFELSEQERAELTEQEQGLYNEIVNAEFSEYNYDELVKAIERFEYTTTALAALAAWYSELGDSDASMMILAFADEFAKYEAKTI